MGTVLGGKDGAVNGSTTVAEWTVSSSADLQAAVASNTKDGTIVLDGNTDWSGSYRAYEHTPAVMPADGFTFTGSIDGTNGVTGTAIVDSVTVNVNQGTGAIIEHTVAFSGNGALTKGAAAAADASTPDPDSSISCKVELGTMVASPVWTEVDDVMSWTFTITAANQSYVSSQTAGVTKRVAGPFSATISYSVAEDDFSDSLSPNDVRAIRLYVNATEFWLFNFAKVADEPDIAVNIETGAVISETLNLQWTAFGDVDGTSTEGEIVQPDLTSWWP